MKKSKILASLSALTAIGTGASAYVQILVVLAILIVAIKK